MGKPYGGGYITKMQGWTWLLRGPNPRTRILGMPPPWGLFFEFFRTLVNQGQNQFYDDL